METTVTILLPELEAKKWLMFQQHYDVFSILVDRGIFDTRNGNVELHFNEHGIVGSIIKHEMIYKMGK